MNKLLFSFICLLIVSFSACKSRKPEARQHSQPAQTPEAVVNKEPTDQLIASVLKMKNTSEALHYNGELEFSDGQQSVTLNVDVNARKGSYVWMNAKAMGMINVARIMLKPDSVRIIDLVNKKYISASYGFLAKFSSAPITYTEVENLVWGNALFDPPVADTRADSSLAELVLTSVLAKITQDASFSAGFKARKVVLSEPGTTRRMMVNYGTFQSVGHNEFPGEVVINIVGEKNVQCRFSLTNFATDVKQDPKFTIPSSYKVEVY